MRKIITAVALISVIFLIGCGKTLKYVEDPDVLKGTVWEYEDIDQYCSFGKSGKAMSYKVWPGDESAEDRPEYTGRYVIYNSSSDKAAELEKKLTGCQPGVRNMFDELTSGMNDPEAIAIIIDLDAPEPEQKSAEEAQQTHFEYFALYDATELRLVMLEPDPDGCDKVHALTSIYK